MTLEELIAKELGVKTRGVENPTGTTSIGLTSSLILRNNPNRFAAVIMNLSANQVYVGLTDGVTATNGIRLNAGGGVMRLLYREDFHMTGWAWWAIASGAGSAIYVLECVGV